MKLFKTTHKQNNKAVQETDYPTRIDYLQAVAEQAAMREHGTDNIFLVTQDGEIDLDQTYVRAKAPTSYEANKAVTYTAKPVKARLAASTEHTRKLAKAYAYDVAHGTAFYAELKQRYAAEDNAAFAKQLGLV